MFNWMGHIGLVNCVFLDNITLTDGGGMFTNHASYELTNCTFSGNSATGRGGGVFNAKLYGPAELRNCILFGNDAFEGPEIGLGLAMMGGGATVVDYCNIRGGRLDVYDPGELLTWGEGNIDSDPCFADAAGDDFHLKSEGGRWDPNEGRWSPSGNSKSEMRNSKSGEGVWVYDEGTSACIDAGDPMSPVNLEPFPNGGIVNMGAYGGMAEASKSYFGGAPCEVIVAGDVNGDCEVDFEDFRLMALHWMEDNAP
jgi:predicted outer membrane repeat protein